MKKILIKDKKKRNLVKNFEKQKFILKSISNNFNFCRTIRQKAFYELSLVPSSSCSVSNLCVDTVNKKKVNEKLSRFSRIVFLKHIRSLDIPEVVKQSR